MYIYSHFWPGTNAKEKSKVNTPEMDTVQIHHPRRGGVATQRKLGATDKRWIGGKIEWECDWICQSVDGELSILSAPKEQTQTNEGAEEDSLFTVCWVLILLF